MFRARAFPLLLVAATAWFVSCTGRTSFPETAGPPNILFILADDLGYGDTGIYGQSVIQTPNIDRLAREGIRFTQHYAGSTVCAPSRCSLMTGLHTGHCYIRGNREVRPMGQLPLPDASLTVAEVLKRAGYRTALVGKWGLGGPDSSGHPNVQGFDDFFGYLCQRHAHNYYPEFLFSNRDRIRVPGNRVDERSPDGSGQATVKETYVPDLLLEEAISFLEENRDGPFFLYFASTLPHANNEAGGEGMEIPSYAPYMNRDWPEPQKGHAAMIARLDKDVGSLLSKLESLGIAERTLVLFSSDNGPHREGGADPAFFNSAGGLRGIKRDLYEGGIRVPLIARWTGKIEPNRSSDHISAFWDFLPTCAELAGVGIEERIDGISYLPELLGKEQHSHDYLYWEFKTMQAVRTGDWKAIRKEPGTAIELYDLGSDPDESLDLATENPDVVEQANEIMREAHTRSELFPVHPQEAESVP